MFPTSFPLLSTGDPGDLHGRGDPGALGPVDAAVRRQGQEPRQRLADHTEVQPGADVRPQRRGLQVGPHQPRDPPNDGHGHAPLRLRFLGVQAPDGRNSGHRVGLRDVIFFDLQNRGNFWGTVAVVSAVPLRDVMVFRPAKRGINSVYSSRGFRVSAVPFCAGVQFVTVNIACRDLVLQRFALNRGSAGSHLSAGVVVWQGTNEGPRLYTVRDGDCCIFKLQKNARNSAHRVGLRRAVVVARQYHIIA